MLFADGDISWAAFCLSFAGSLVAVATLFINRRFDGKLLLLEAAQQRCEQDAIKKDAEILELRREITAVHERGNVAALDRNVMRGELDTVKKDVARHETVVLPAVEKVIEALPEVAGKIKKPE